MYELRKQLGGGGGGGDDNDDGDGDTQVSTNACRQLRNSLIRLAMCMQSTHSTALNVTQIRFMTIARECAL